MEFTACCAICNEERAFSSADDYWSCRDGLLAADCGLGGCVTRERAMAKVLFSIWDRSAVSQLAIHEAAPVTRGLTLWLKENCSGYVPSGYYPDMPFGSSVGGIRNEDLMAQTFEDSVFDLVIHLDVLEHLFQPYNALNEIHRTLKPGGFCLFTVPTERGRVESEQVAFVKDGVVQVVGEPEYHGNPQRPEDGALVTYRYGDDFPLQIFRNTNFRSVEHRRFMDQSSAAIGYMSDVYILQKSGR